MKKAFRNLSVLSLFLALVVGVLPVWANAADDIAINEENFPNAAFRGYVLSQIDIDRNETLTEDEINAVTWIDIESRWIDYGHLVGLNFFLALEKLTGTNVSLHVLDVSKNLRLKHLSCPGNQLQSLDVRNNIALEYLDCHSNSIQKLLIGNNNALKTLECHYNSIQMLDISNCPDLNNLTCQNNSIKTLDISHNKYLCDAYLNGTKKHLTDGGIQYYTSSGYQVINSLSISPDCEITCVSIFHQPKDQTVIAGKEATFSVTGQGGNINYQWYQQRKGETNWTELPGETQNKLTIKVNANLNGSKYRCVLRCEGNTNSAEVSSNAATLKVLTKPKITTQPKAASVKAGKKVTFKVKATGGELKYQWYYQKPGTKKWVKMSGKTKATLSFTAKKNKNGYKYRCLVKNEAGKTYTKAVKLTVK